MTSQPDSPSSSRPSLNEWTRLTELLAAEYPAATRDEISEALASAVAVTRLFGITEDVCWLVRLTARHSLDERAAT